MPRPQTPALIFWYVGIVLFVLLGVTPFDLWFDSKISLSTGVSGPSLDHWLGTDNLGRDLLVRLSQSIRGAVLPLWFGCLFATFLGCLFGLLTIVSQQRKVTGFLTNLVNPFATFLVSIPIGVAAFSWAAIQEKAGLLPVLVSLIVVFSFRTMLQIQDFYRHDRQLGYWEAHASMGGNLLQRLVSYGVVGRWKWGLLETLAFHLKAAVAIEASLSYLGFGIQEPAPSFGNILSSHLDLFLSGQWLILIEVVVVLALCAAAPAFLSNILQSHLRKPSRT